MTAYSQLINHPIHKNEDFFSCTDLIFSLSNIFSSSGTEMSLFQKCYLDIKVLVAVAYMKEVWKHKNASIIEHAISNIDLCFL